MCVTLEGAPSEEMASESESTRRGVGDILVERENRGVGGEQGDGQKGLDATRRKVGLQGFRVGGM